MWKVELRDNCKECGGPLPNARFRTFCSKTCRTKANNRKASAYQINYHRTKREEVKHSLSTK